MSVEGGADQQSPRIASPPRLQPTYKFTTEELRVLKECNKEAFYQRCLPLSALFGFSTYYAVQTNLLRPNPRFGASPKVAVAVVLGYFAGKFSYQSKCAEKLMQLPNSQIGEMLRKRRAGTFQESLDSTFGPTMSLSPFGNISESDTYTDLSPRNSLDMDTSRPDYGGLDDTHRPSMDNPIYEEEMPPEQKHITTYDELRRKNREEYQQKRTLYAKEAPRAPPTIPTAPPTNPESPSVHKNKYGDLMD